ncbi:MAG: hypothetical protein Pg6A_15750 [Termitinemataceae bacterium]|nr:MAG: hypothetical protein Pg6A_15750 [Termitinemataceae bacterium]
MFGIISATPEIIDIKRGKEKGYACSIEFGANDVRTAWFFPGTGIDSAPVKGDIVICDYIGSDLVITNIKSQKPQAKSGEHHRYIRDGNGEIVGEYHFTQDGALSLKAKTPCVIELGANKIEAGESSLLFNGNLEVLQ